jgi:membrane protease YdiL (CAAX protease family)
MSVAVQELVYRTFFFHRYGALFGRAWWLAILLSGVLFGLGHIVIGTQLAVYSTMATGMLFAYRYVATRSFWAVFIEHTLWGALVFTIGLGQFFFAGVGILSWRW